MTRADDRAHVDARLKSVADRHDSADSLLDKIQNFVETNSDAVLAGWTSEKLDFDEDASLG